LEPKHCILFSTDNQTVIVKPPKYEAPIISSAFETLTFLRPATALLWIYSLSTTWKTSECTK